MSLDMVIPFLAPLDEYLIRKDVSELMINDDRRVFVEIAGELLYVGEGLVSNENVEQAVKRAARLNGDDFSPARPNLDTMLADGSRLAAMFRCCTSGATSLAIRKFKPNWFSLDELVANGTIPENISGFLVQSVNERKSVLVSGGTGSGKTTLTKALMDCIPAGERIGVIEDTREIKVDNQNAFRFVARRGIDNIAPVTIRDLVKASLRYRPDRILLGEVRGGEAFDLLDALNTGHAGSISTLHANSGAHALKRLASLAMRADAGIPLEAIQEDIKDLIDVSVHVSRMPDRTRKVVTVEEKGQKLYERSN